MFCESCGGALGPTTRFCPGCGAAVVHPAVGDQAASPISHPQNKDQRRKWSAGKIIFLGCGTLVLIAAGIAAAVFFGIKYAFKSSDAAKAAVQALEQSSNARRSLGEITSVGTPLGSISSEAGGSGEATLSMAVMGTRASGKYYSTLQRRNGQWMLVSGRIDLADGRSVNVEAPASGLSISVHGSAGRQLKNDSVDAGAWKEISWPQQNVTLRVPSNWIQKETGQRQLDIRGGEIYSSTYLMANAWVWERPLPSENLLAADVQTASESLKNGVIAGYAVREIGGVTGLLTISSVGDRFVATWKALVPAGHEQKSIDVSLGAPFRVFNNLEPTFNAILDSIRFD